MSSNLSFWADGEALEADRSGFDRHARAAPIASRELLQATMDSSMDMIQVFEAVRDGQDHIVDFRWVLNNHAAERQHGDVIGKRLLRQNPGVVDEGIFDTFKRVVETGEPDRSERHYVHEQFNGWYLQSTVRLGDGVATTTTDITRRKQAEQEVLRLRDEAARARLGETEQRLAAIFADAPVGLSEVSLDGRFLRVNEELCRILGRSRDVLLRSDISAVTHPDDIPPSLDRVARTVATGEPASLDKRYRRPDGSEIWAHSTVSLLRDQFGRPQSLLVVTADLTARRNAEAALRASEERFRALATLVPALLWETSADGSDVALNARWLDYTGQSVEETQGGGWLDAIHPDDRANSAEILARGYATGEPIMAEHRVRSRDGTYRWFLVRQSPIRDEAGRVVRWLGAGIDVQEQRELQERQELLVAELQHRVRNILTVIRSVFSRTVEAGSDPEDAADHFRGRLDALARTQVLATASAEGWTDLENLVRDELLSVGATDGTSVRISGPEVRLLPKQAEMLGLAIHELTTNALKYGALKITSAQLDIRWRVNIDYRGGSRLEFAWTEQGVPTVPVQPSREGFGRELIEEALPYRLGAETELQFLGGGVRCRISMPLSKEGASVLPMKG